MVGSPLKILIVEDEFLIALDLAAQIAELGFTAVGPAESLEQATTLLAAVHPDAALLDIDLRGQPVFPLARQCIRQGVPFIFVTACLPDDVPEDLLHVPVLGKPWAVGQLERLVIGMFP